MKIRNRKTKLSALFISLAMILSAIAPIAVSASSGGADVKFAASAVCTDVSAKNGADELWLVFEQATNKEDIMGLLTLDGANTFGTSTGAWDTTGSIYKITLADAEIADNAKITLANDDTLKTSATDEIINDYTADIAGSFTGLGAPKAVAALISDQDGTARTEGDMIYVSFNKPTNKAKDTTETFVGGNLDGASGIWLSPQVLAITLGTAEISASDTIDLTVLGIKDLTGTLDAENVSAIALTGSFGTALKPRVVRAVAVSKTGRSSASEGDEVVIMFNTLVTHNNITVKAKDGSFGTDFDNEGKDALGNNRFIKWEDNGVTTLTLTLGADPDVELNKTAVSLEGDIKDGYSNKLTCENTDYIKIKDGAFGIKIVPELINATIVKTAEKPVAAAGDKVVLAFSAPTNKMSNLEAYFGGVFGSGARGEWNEAGTVYTVTLGTNSSLSDGATVTLQASSGLKDQYEITDVPSAGRELKGSFGTANKPQLLSATAIKTTLKAKAQPNDEIVLVFSAMTNKADILNKILADEVSALGAGAVGEWDLATGTIYTVKLGTGAEISDNALIKIDNATGVLKDVYDVVAADTQTVTLEGTFGTPEVEVPQIVSATGYSAGNSDYLKITFNMETNLDTIVDNNFKNTLKANNPFLGDISDIITTKTAMTIKLAEDAAITTDNIVNLAGLGIKSKTDTELADVTAQCGGYIVPLVKNVEAGLGTVTVSFTTRTNKAAVDLSGLSALYGENASAEWTDAKTLKITLGKNYSISERGYVTLDNLGIKDGYAKSYVVSGQYKIQQGSLTGDELAVRNVIASSATTKVVKAAKDDIITVTFTHETNKPSDDIVDRVEADGQAVANPFGTGASFVWKNSKTLVITLGDAPEIARGNVIFFKTDKIEKLSGGALSTESAVVKGSFDGRDYYISGEYSKSTASGGDHQFKITIDDTSENVASRPTVVCVGYRGNIPVVISRVSLDVNESADILFTFSGSQELTNAKVYVFNNLFDDIASSPEVLAEQRLIGVN